MRGLRPEDVAARPILADNIVVGSLADYGVDDGILIGARLAQQLGVGVGGNVTLVSPSGNTTVMGTVPRMKTYRIAGLFERSEEHTSELQSLMRISYAVFCLKKNTKSQKR